MRKILYPNLKLSYTLVHYKSYRGGCYDYFYPYLMEVPNTMSEDVKVRFEFKYAHLSFRLIVGAATG